VLNRGARTTTLLLSITAATSLTLGAALSAGAQAPGESTLDRIVANGVLRFGVPIAGLPVAAKDESGAVVGVIPDMAAEMAKALSGPDTPDAVRLELVDTPAADRIPYIQAGQIDVSVGTVTLQRALVVGFTDPWAVDGTGAAVLKSSGITDYSQVTGKRIAVVTGATGDLVATEQFPENEISRVDLASTALQAVVSGQADIVFDDLTFLGLAAAENPDLLLLGQLTFEPSGLMAPIGDQVWINWLNYFLNDYYGSGVSTCGCGLENLEKWFMRPAGRILFDY
jgi:polar amino acid transport system substrate-binding protein